MHNQREEAAQSDPTDAEVAKLTPARRRILRLVVFVLFSLLLFVTLEICARIYVATKDVPKSELESPWKSGIYQSHPYLVFVPRPHYFNPSYKNGYLSINSLGFRGPDISMEKPLGTIRFVCLGGSTTFSIKVGNEDTYPRQLEQKLRQTYPKRKIEVINAGVPTYTSVDSLLNLWLRVLDLQPDVIIVYHAINDVYARMMPGFCSDYSHWRIGSAIPDTPMTDVCARHCTLFAGIRYKFIRNSGIDHRATQIDHLLKIPPEQRLRNLENASSATFRRNIEMMVHIAKTRNIRIVLSTFVLNDSLIETSRTSPMHKAYSVGVMEHNHVMEAISAKEGCLLVDVAAEFPSSNSTFFDGLFHMNSAGTLVKAQIFHDAIMSAGLID